MRSPKISSGQFVKADAGWVSGMNTIRNPWILREDQYQRAVNIVNRGGLIQTRPGYGMRLIAPAGNFQGFESFKLNKTLSDGTKREEDWMLIACNGNIYALPFPLAQPRRWEDFRLNGIKFDANTPYIYFCQAEKSLQLLSDQTVQTVPTYNVMMMQSGLNDAAYWDGDIAEHIDETAPNLGTPRGTWMVWSGSRLWIVRGKLMIASDLLDPLKFIERTQGEGRGDFSFPKLITGAASFVDSERNEIVVVFTEDRSEILKSGIRDRATWPLTSNFQSILFPSTGCVSGWSIVFQAGLMWWYSQGGLVSSDSAASSFLTSQVNFKDAEMAFSKQYFTNDLSGICGLSFENYLLMSVPVGEKLNSETFVLDYATMSESSAEHIPAWNSSWTGIRPIKWLSANINGQRRAFAASVDYTTLSDGSHNHIWEAFLPEREDSFFELNSDFTVTEYKQPIFWEWESRLLGDGLELKSFRYADLDFREISGDVTISVSYRGNRGPYKEIACKKILAQTSYENSGAKGFEDDEDSLGQLRKQSRRITTQVAQDIPSCGTCESGKVDNIDKCFSFLVRCCGQAALESINMFMDPYPEKSNGVVEKDETQICVVDEKGINHIYDRIKGFIPEEDLYKQVQGKVWLAKKSKTTTLSCDFGSITGDIIVTAVATYRSLISQDDANNQADEAAQEAADAQAGYYRTIYPCYFDSTKLATRNCYSSLDDDVKGIAIQPGTENLVLIGEFDFDKTVSQSKLTARHSDGTRKLDYVQGSGFVSSPKDLQIDSTGRAIIVGFGNSYDGNSVSKIIRLLPTGEYDPSFIIGTGFDNNPEHVLLQGDKILVSGSFTDYDGNTVPGMVRLSGDGTFDNTFDASAAGFISAGPMAFTSDGRIFVVVERLSEGDSALILLSEDGVLDGSFTPYVLTFNITALAVQSNDFPVVSCSGINSGKGIARLDLSGGLDSFNIGTGFDNDVYVIFNDPVDGAFYIGGSFFNVDGTPYPYIIKLLADGTPDPSFATNLAIPPDAGVFSIASGEIGELYIGGAFTEIGGDANGKKFARIAKTGYYIPSYETVTQYSTVRSTIDQADADTQAQDQADSLALAALPCP